MISVCSLCNLEIPDCDLVSHLEKIHVGPRLYEGIEIGCGQCEFVAFVGNLADMIEHCAVIGHRVEGVSADWSPFLQRESKRIASILRLGVNIVRKKEERKLCEEVTPKVKRRFPPKMKPRNILTADEKRKLSSEEEENLLVVVDDPIETKKEMDDDETEEEFATPKQMIKREKLETLPKLGTRRRKRIPDALKGATLECALCDFQAPFERLKQTTIRHIFTHGPELRPLKCNNCDYRSGQKCSFVYHAQLSVSQQRGCDGSYSNIQTEEMIRKTRDLIQKAFPSIDWEEKLPRGEENGGIRF